MKKFLFLFLPLFCFPQSTNDQINNLKYYLSGEDTFMKKTVEINYNKSVEAFYVNLNTVMPPTNSIYVHNTSCRFKKSDINEISSFYKDNILIVDVKLSSNKCEHTYTKNNLTPEIKIDARLSFMLDDIGLDDKKSFEDAVNQLFGKNIISKN